MQSFQCPCHLRRRQPFPVQTPVFHPDLRAIVRNQHIGFNTQLAAQLPAERRTPACHQAEGIAGCFPALQGCRIFRTHTAVNKQRTVHITQKQLS